MKMASKTNVTWYAYPELSFWFRLEDDVLLFCPMQANSRPDLAHEDAVDFYDLWDADPDEAQQYDRIVAELTVRP
jgi:hypothetical protein